MRTAREVRAWAIAVWAAGLVIADPATALAADTTPPTQPGAITVTGMTESSAVLLCGWAAASLPSAASLGSER
jgi:hypothetical protein